MQEGQLCPKCEEGTLEERIEGDYDYLICNKCYKRQAHTIPFEIIRYFERRLKEIESDKPE